LFVAFGREVAVARAAYAAAIDRAAELGWLDLWRKARSAGKKENSINGKLASQPGTPLRSWRRM